jgi:hypothetical protein
MSDEIDLEGLAPLIAAGITPDDPDADRENYERSKAKDGEQVIKDTLKGGTVEGTRIPVPRFIATDDDDTIWQDGVTDRIQRGAVLSHPPEVVEAIRTGHICIQCLEPHLEAFPLACSLCGFSMREFQAQAFEAHFEGNVNYGPSLKLQAVAEAKRMRDEMAAFEKRMKNGGSPMKGLRHGAS